VELTEITRGKHLSIVWAVDAAGAMPAREFFEGLDDGDKAKVVALFNRLAEFGVINNHEKFKNLGAKADGLFEFKSFQLRFLGDFRPGKLFVVALGVRKKKDTLDRADIAKAVRVLAEYDAKTQRAK